MVFAPFLHKYLKTTSKLEQFAPEKMQNFLNTYKESMAAHSSVGGGEAFNTYVSNRFSTINSFAKIQLENEETLGNLFKDIDKNGDPASKQAAKAIKDSLVKAFTVLPKTETATKDFATNIETLNDMMKKSPLAIEAVANHLHVIKSDALSAIKLQQEDDKTKLEALFKDPAFNQNLIKSLNLSENELPKVQKNMLDALEKQAKQELSQFDTILNTELLKLHSNNMNELYRIGFLANVRNINDFNQAIFNNIAKQKAPPGQPLQVGQDSAVQADDFKDLSIAQLFSPTDVKSNIGKIKTLTGLDMTYDGKTFTVELPKWGPYYHDTHDKMLYDMNLVAQAVRASGHDSITMSVNYPASEKDEDQSKREFVMEMGRKAYHSALMAGFEPDKIAVKVNGKVMSADELFASHPAERKKAERETERANKGMNGILQKPDFNKEPSTEITTKMRKEMQEFRDKNPVTTPTVSPPLAASAAASPQ